MKVRDLRAEAKNEGKPDLKGSVQLHCIYADEEGFMWSEDAKAIFSDCVRQCMSRLEDEAKEEDVPLHILVTEQSVFFTCTGNPRADRSQIMSELVEHMGKSELEDVSKHLLSESGAEQVVLIFAFNKDFRAYAATYRSRKSSGLSLRRYVLMPYKRNDYECQKTLTHEFLHLFGADDLYLPYEVDKYVSEHFPDSIMNSGLHMDPVTKYLIGWVTQLSPEAQRLLDMLESKTSDYMTEQRRKQRDSDYSEVHTSKGLYKGALKNGYATGRGRLEFADGRVYEGDFVEGWFCGRGRLTYPDGSVFEGEFVRGHLNGKGKAIWPDGEFYDGYFVDGVPHGKGRYTYANGDVYEGEWSDGEPHGKGRLTYADGRVEEGTWDNDELVGSPE